MTRSIEAYRDAAKRGIEWLVSQQNPDGSLITDDVQADVYHKAPYAMGITGHAAEAERLMSWVKANDLGPDGRLKHFDAGLALYKTNWACQSAHRLARFDISVPVFGYILRCQAPCGGFYQVEEGNPFVEAVCTSWAGVTAIYHGRTDVAERAALCLISMIEQQPDVDRFYYTMTPDGWLATEESPIDGAAPHVDATQTQQAYYCPGIASLFLARLHLATGNPVYQVAAMRLFEISLGFAEDRYSYPTAGKSTVGAATLYRLTGDERARDAAREFGDFLVEAQDDEGWWANPYDQGMITRLDHTAEFIVFISEIAALLHGAEGQA